MSRLNTKQRRARFRNSKRGKQAEAYIEDRVSFSKHGPGGWAAAMSERFPLLRGTKAIP